MIRHIISGLLLASLLGISQIHATEASNNLTLHTLFNKVENNNANLKAKEAAIKTALSKQKQAGVLPNPEIELESENIYGSGQTQGLDLAETTLKLSERIEWGGKRKARLNAAHLQLQESQLELEQTRQTLFLRAFERYITVISNQQRVAISKEQRNLYQQFLNTVDKQVKSGRLPEAERIRAEIHLIQAELAIEKETHEFNESLSRLSMMWNETGHIPAPSVEVIPVPSHNLEELQAHAEGFVDRNLSYRHITNQYEQAKQAIFIEKSLGSQDPVFSGGLKKDNGSNTTSFVAGIGISLAIFDQNKGSIDAASFRAKEWEHQLKFVENELLITYEHTFHHAHLLQEEASLLIEKIIPKTKSVYSQVKQGYLQGKYAYLDVLTAQNDWVEAQQKVIEVLGDYWKTVAELELILGHSLDHQLPQLFAQTKETTHD